MADTLTSNSADQVETLKSKSREAFQQYNNSCSDAVKYVLTALVDPQFPDRDANGMVDYFMTSSDWKEVTLDEGHRLAQQGVVVVGGLKEPGKHGHVVLIYPGEKKMFGGYLVAKKDKKTGQEAKEMLQGVPTRTYPLAMSTLMGVWPGAKSNGDKTVWDAWTELGGFKDVKWWTHR